MHPGALHFGAPTYSVGGVSRSNPRTTSQVPSPDLRALGWAVKQAREEKGWTIERLAEESELGRRTVLTVEAGEKAPNIKTLHALAYALEVPLGQLVEAVGCTAR